MAQHEETLSEHFFLIKGTKFKLQVLVDWEKKKIHEQIEEIIPFRIGKSKKRKNCENSNEKPSKKLVQLFENERCESAITKLMDQNGIMWEVIKFLDVEYLAVEMLLICKRWTQMITKEMNGAWKSSYLSLLEVESTKQTDEVDYRKEWIQFKRSQALNSELIYCVYEWEDNFEAGLSELDGFSDLFEKYSRFAHLFQFKSSTKRNNTTKFNSVVYNMDGNGYKVVFSGKVLEDGDTITIDIKYRDSESSGMLLSVEKCGSNPSVTFHQTKFQKLVNKLSMHEVTDLKQLLIIFTLNLALSAGMNGHLVEPCL